MQAANIDAEASGINDSEYQLTKHDFSSIGRGKYSGKNDLCSLSACLISAATVAKESFSLLFII